MCFLCTLCTIIIILMNIILVFTHVRADMEKPSKVRSKIIHIGYTLHLRRMGEDNIDRREQEQEQGEKTRTRHWVH